MSYLLEMPVGVRRLELAEIFAGKAFSGLSAFHEKGVVERLDGETSPYLTKDSAAPFRREFYEWGHSTQALEVTADASMLIRIPTGASYRDYQWARRIAQVICERHHVPLFGDDGRRSEPHCVQREFDGAWIEQEVGADLMHLMARADRLPVGRWEVHDMLGHDFCLGPKLAQQLRVEAGAVAQLSFALHQRMRRLLYVDDDVVRARVLGHSRSGYTLSLWGPGTTYIFSDVDFLALIDVEPIHVTKDQVLDLVGPIRSQLLDERHLLVTAHSDAEWLALLSRARRVQCTPSRLSWQFGRSTPWQ